MDRRRFCASALAAAVAASIPGKVSYSAVFSALTAVTADIAAVTGAGREITLEKAAVQELKDSLRGELLLSGSEGYDRARRVLNPGIDKYPALIVRPFDAADVASAVRFAADRDLLLAVKCGGHSFSGKSTCDGGLQIDLTPMRHVRVDRNRRRAHVAGGTLLGGLDHEAMAWGLATTAGTVSHTGVGGLTLGGGFGRLARRYGLALDNVKSVDIVTADGEFRRASAEQNPDLYWAVRGGGGNFGVVTSFEFELHPMNRTVIAGDVVFPIERAREVHRFYADYMREAPDELDLILIQVAPPGGEPGVILMHATYSGDASQAPRVLAPFEKLGDPVANTIGPNDYVALQKAWDNSDPRHGGDYLKGAFVSEISDSMIDAIVEGFEAHPDRATNFFFQPSGGAINRVPADATAFPHRGAVNGPSVIVSWQDGADPDPHVRYIRDYWSTLEKFTDGYYTNLAEDEPSAVLNRNFRGNYLRLVEIKNKYDPGNLFRLNANIEPTV